MEKCEYLLIGLVIGFMITIIGFCIFDGIHQKFCPECGRSYKQDRNYCNYDGTELKLKGVCGEV